MLLQKRKTAAARIFVLQRLVGEEGGHFPWQDRYRWPLKEPRPLPTGLLISSALS